MITKKDFNNIAELIRLHLKEVNQKDEFVKQLCDYFEKQNPNFSRGLFIHACNWKKA